MSCLPEQPDNVRPESPDLPSSEPNIAPSDEPLPNYSSNASLVPMAPGQNGRYARTALVVPESIRIPRGLHSTLLSPEPPYLAVGWVQAFNPEGTPYYVNESKHLVTDDPICHPDISSRITTWTEKMDILIEAEDLVLPEDYEIFITVAADNDGCKYYFVDHTTRTVFWLEEIDPGRHGLELAQVCSITHMHQLTSDDSTFPYSAEQCKQYLEIIDIETECNAYMTWIVARLWGTISRHKFSTFYGEDHAKISRMQRRFETVRVERACILKLCSALLFGMSKTRSAELDSLSVDELTYVVHWREFATDLLHGWRESSWVAVGLALIGSVSAVQQGNAVSQCMGIVSVMFALAGLSSGGMLLQWYAGAEKFNATKVANHLARIQVHGYGYEPIAQAFCLPRAPVFWSIIFLAAHILSAVVDVYDLIVRSPAILFTLLFVGGLVHLNRVLHAAFDNPVIEPVSDLKSFGFLDGARVCLHRMGGALRKAFHISPPAHA
ncbi:hypothetical protein GSI_06637 [Ganoderma sinense ZZ0214-1]|uniref:WW domain-containing protein n=1 Tax=Ganoderma sinense ZZ0214-1 TaxID=1077348 RepID=A0A2G8SDW1_9APHY|nr:hypothetical protein GSI_06637 [Ganoderma sinense ZZ0214-1]